MDTVADGLIFVRGEPAMRLPGRYIDVYAARNHSKHAGPKDCKALVQVIEEDNYT